MILLCYCYCCYGSYVIAAAVMILLCYCYCCYDTVMLLLLLLWYYYVIATAVMILLCYCYCCYDTVLLLLLLRCVCSSLGVCGESVSLSTAAAAAARKGVIPAQQSCVVSFSQARLSTVDCCTLRDVQSCTMLCVIRYVLCNPVRYSVQHVASCAIL